MKNARESRMKSNDKMKKQTKSLILVDGAGSIGVTESYAELKKMGRSMEVTAVFSDGIKFITINPDKIIYFVGVK